MSGKLSESELAGARKKYVDAKTLPHELQAAKRVHLSKCDHMDDWWVGYGKDESCQIEGSQNHWRWLAMLILGLADECDAPYSEQKDTPEFVEAMFAHIDALTAENERLRQRLLTAAGDDLCRLSQEEIKDLTGGKVPIPPKEEFLASCERFHAQVAGEDGVNQNCLTLAQLVAENERLTREMEEAKDMLANWVTSCVYCGEEWTCSEDTYESSCAEHDKICEKHPLREVERELAAAQQRLAAPAVDATKREELVEGAYNASEREACERNGNRAFIPFSALMSDRKRRYRTIVEHAFAAGRLSRDSEVAELRRQLDEARKWESQYKRLYENCDASHEKTLKQLSEATKRLADLTEKLAAAERTAKAANDGREHAVRNQDCLAAELADTKQALAAARGEVDRMRAACEPFKAYADEIPAAMPEDYLLVPHELTVREWRELRGAIEPVQSSAPANPAASVPVGLCPKCGIQPLTKEGDDMIRLGEKDYICGNCKRYLCRPIEPKGAASEPDDSSHTPETAHTSSSQSETAERRFVCPRCGSRRRADEGCGSSFAVNVEPLWCGNCGHQSTWPEVEAANGEQGKFPPDDDGWHVAVLNDGSPAHIAESSRVLKNSWGFIVDDVGYEPRAVRVVPASSLVIIEQQLAAANQAREAAEQNLKATAELLGVVSAEAKELRQRAEAAEAAAGLMKDALTKGDELNLNNNRGVSVYDALRRLRDGSMSTPDNSWFGWAFDRIDKALATDPGRAANELRTLRTAMQNIVDVRGKIYSCDSTLNAAIEQGKKAFSAETEATK